MGGGHFDMGKCSARPLDPDTGELELKHVQTLFIEWLVNDRQPGESQKDFAKRWDVSEGTLSRWKKDRDFRAEWERRMRETHASPDRLEKVMDAIYDRAGKGDMKAAELYLKAIDKMTPTRIEIDSKQTLAEMSDEELAAMAENVSFLKDAR